MESPEDQPRRRKSDLEKTFSIDPEDRLSDPDFEKKLEYAMADRRFPEAGPSSVHEVGLDRIIAARTRQAERNRRRAKHQEVDGNDL